MKSLIEDLKKNIRGETESPSGENAFYDTDESIFRVSPKVIICPKDEADVMAIVSIASHHKIPITARGGGTGIAGQSIGSGIIADFSKHMNQILDISADFAIVHPGVILGDLNLHLAKQKKIFAPDPGSKNICTVGGMIATNAAGPRAMVYGSTRDHIETLDAVLFDAKKYNSDELTKKNEPLVSEIKKNEDRIRSAKRNVEKNSSGYHLESLLEKEPAFEKLFVGSEGTLGIVTEATLKITDLIEQSCFAVFGYSSTKNAIMDVISLRETKPLSIELLNDTILELLSKLKPSLMNELGLRDSFAALWVEWKESVPADIKKKAVFSTSSQETIRKISTERSLISRHLHQEAEKENRKPLRCIEDACVPLQNLVSYVDEVSKLLVKHDAVGAIFGHVGCGHLHINPAIRMDLPKLQERVGKLMDEFYAIVLKMGGTISGEHGDGVLRVKYAKQQWKEIWPLFESVKRTFDPKGIFNPDKKVPITSSKYLLKY